MHVKDMVCPMIAGFELAVAEALNEGLMFVLLRKETDVAAKAFTTRTRERIARTHAVDQRMFQI
jgi:hypothetical protein